MAGVLPNIVEFETAAHHAMCARQERLYAREMRRRRSFYDARGAEECARYHEQIVRGIAALAMVTADRPTTPSIEATP